MKKILLTVAGMMMSLCIFANDSENTEITTGTITVKIVGISDLEGKLFIGVGDMTKPQQMKGAVLDVEDYEMGITFEGVEFGNTSINVFQDMNGNNQLDFGDFGKPAEPCATQNITFDKENTSFEIELKKY